MAGPLPEGQALGADGSLDSSVSLNYSPEHFSAYIHIPFCQTRCGYCDFNTYTATELDGVSQRNFVDDINQEIDFSAEVLTRAQIPKRRLSTIFFGGGTPTLLPATDLIHVVEKLRTIHGLTADCEITTEANPDTLTEEYAMHLAEAGFTRVSIGMQSAEPAVLAVLDRTHNPENVVRAVRAVQQAGMQVSVDLIYGSPGETLEQWESTLEAAVELNTDHISAYALIVEEGTSLARKINRGELPVPNDDLHARMYEVLDSRLTQAGFSWYELSNWSTSPHTQSRHNLAYWYNTDWWGFGPGAHSHIGGQRFWNVKHPAAYAARLKEHQTPVHASEVPTSSQHQLETLMLHSRLSAGFVVEGELLASVPSLLNQGLIVCLAESENRYMLTLPGRLRADEVVRRIAWG